MKNVFHNKRCFFVKGLKKLFFIMKEIFLKICAAMCFSVTPSLFIYRRTTPSLFIVVADASSFAVDSSSTDNQHNLLHFHKTTLPSVLW